MSDDTSKLLNACMEYRAKLDELEDENRRLHVELDAYYNGEQLRVLRAENAALRAAIEESEEFARKNGETLAAKVSELLRENAALRRDSDRLDWLITKGPVEVLVTLSSDPVVARANIDREMEFPTV